MMTEAKVDDVANKRLKVRLISLVNYSVNQPRLKNDKRLTPYRIAGSPDVETCSALPRTCHRFSRIVAPSPRMSPARRQTARRFCQVVSNKSGQRKQIYLRTKFLDHELIRRQQFQKHKETFLPQVRIEL